jgi:hypothetical protein
MLLVDVDLVDCGNRIRLCGGTTEENGHFWCPPPPNFVVESMGITGIILFKPLVARVGFL